MVCGCINNDKAIFGAGSDLQIWHDATAGASKIYDAGAGNLELISNGGGVRFSNPSDEDTFNVINGGATTVYHNRVAKLATTATGVDVTGTVTADGLTVDGPFTSKGIDDNASATAVTIAASGNVGIGTATPNAKLDVAGDLRLAHNNPIEWGGTAYSIVGNATTGYLQFNTASTERMRIDSSGNVLVGKTTSDTGAAQGHQFDGPNGIAYLTRTNAPTMYLRRNSSDGNIVEFRKDGTAVGSIGSINTELFIGSTGGADAFIRLGSNTVAPATSTGLNRDAAISIGSPTGRFKDLYLSGGVVFGTGGPSPITSNTLDDYEEGTWTPSATSGITINSIETATYTKVGRQVTLSAWLKVDITVADFLFAGFPFSVLGRTCGSVTNPATDESIANQCLSTSCFAYGANTAGTNDDLFFSVTYNT